MRADRPYLLLKRLRLRWSDVEPLFTRETAEAFARDQAHELDPRWEGDELVLKNPRWDAKQQREYSEQLCVRPNRDGLYPLGDFGRARALSLPLSDWEWKEVFPPWPQARLDGKTIAALLDSPLPSELSPKNRGPVLERIESQAGVPELVEALRRVETDDARRMLGYLLAYHERAGQAGPALPVLVEQFSRGRGEARKHAAGAIAALASRLGPAAALASAPGRDDVLARELEEEEDEAVRVELEQALGALGRRVADDPFVAEAIRRFEFLEREHGFPAPTVEDPAFAHVVRYRNDVVAVEVSYEWRERWARRLDREAGGRRAAESGRWRAGASHGRGSYARRLGARRRG